MASNAEAERVKQQQATKEIRLRPRFINRENSLFRAKEYEVYRGRQTASRNSYRTAKRGLAIVSGFFD